MSDDDVWRLKLARPASRMILGGFRPPTDPHQSWFGKVLVGATGDAWPIFDGKPMWPLCQINCGELPYRPDSISDISVIAAFIAPETLPHDAPNGDGWCLRTYGPSAELRPLAQLAHPSPIKPFPIRWELIEADYPTHDDLPDDFPQDLLDNYYESNLFANHSASKVGGWPTNIQSEIFWAPFNRHPANPNYVFQIDTEPKANWAWGDRGVGYFGRGPDSGRDTWAMSWQCF